MHHPLHRTPQARAQRGVRLGLCMLSDGGGVEERGVRAAVSVVNDQCSFAAQYVLADDHGAAGGGVRRVAVQGWLWSV